MLGYKQTTLRTHDLNVTLHQASFDIILCTFYY